MKHCPLCHSEVSDTTPENLTIHGVTVDFKTEQVTRDGKDLHLTRREYDVLTTLMFNNGRVLSRDTLCWKVWGVTYEGLTNIVDVYITYLRKKIDNGFAESVIKTVRYSGYSFQLCAKKDDAPLLEEVKNIKSYKDAYDEASEKLNELV